MSEEPPVALGEFFDYMWHDTPGRVYLPVIHGESGQLTKYMYEWPRQRHAVVTHVIKQNSLGNDVYYAPAVFNIDANGPAKENVKGTWTYWADFDGKAPDNWNEYAAKYSIPAPTKVVQSSVKGHEHVYWALAAFVSDIQQIDSRNRAIAYSLGADSGGWDADQILRPPTTTNYGWSSVTGSDGRRIHKPWHKGNSLQVRTTSTSDTKINPNVFNPLGTPERIIAGRIELGDLPALSEVFMAGRWPAEFSSLFNLSKDDAGLSSGGGRSGALMRLGYFGAENGFTDEQVYVVLEDADSRWEKYYHRHNRKEMYLDIIARARAKHGYIRAEDIDFSSLIKKSNDAVIMDSKLVYRFDEFLELEVNVSWLLEDLLRSEGVGLITGVAGVGKTQLSIQLGTSIALGIDFIGWKNEAGPKKVLFLSLEMPTIPLKIFWKSISRAYTGNLRELGRNFNVSPVGEGVPTDRIEGQAFLDRLLFEYQPDVIIIDSMQKVTSKALTDEIATRAMLEFFDKLRMKHHCAMIIVHHNRKKGNNGEAAGDLADLYGSQYIAANVDFVLNLSKLPMKDVLNVDSWKNKLGPTRDPFDVVRDKNLHFMLSTEVEFEGLTNGGINFNSTRNLTGRTSEPGEQSRGVGMAF